MADKANLALKKQAVDEIKRKIQKSKCLVILDYKGLTVAQDTDFRSEMRKSKVEYKVLKNTLVKIALNELGYNQYDAFLNGPTAIAFSYDDAVAPAKAAKDGIRKFNKMALKCGMVEGQFIDAQGVETLAALPPREVLIAQLLGTMNAPITGLAQVLSGVLRQLVTVLDKASKKA